MVRKNISGKVFETCCVASLHGFCADDFCSLPISKWTRRRHELQSFRFKCECAQSRLRTFAILVAWRSLAVVAERFVLKTLFATPLLLWKCFCFVVLRCCKSVLRFRVGSFQRRAPWPCLQPCGWLRGRGFGLCRFLWFCAVCPLGMRACATTRAFAIQS